MAQSAHVKRVFAERAKTAKIDPLLEAQFSAGRCAPSPHVFAPTRAFSDFASLSPIFSTRALFYPFPPSSTSLHLTNHSNPLAVVDTTSSPHFSRLYASISSRPGQSGRADGYVLEGDELNFYLKRLKAKSAKHAA